MSLPDLRCLLCDRTLLDENTAQAAERCVQCGKLVQLGTPAVPPPLPAGEQAGFTPGEGSLLNTAFDGLPEAVPVIPVVQPRPAVPVGRPNASAPPAFSKPNWVPPIQSHPPVPPHEDQIDRPKPKYGCAILTLLGFFLMAMLAVTFIVYAIARGLRKPPKTEPTPTKVVTDAVPQKVLPEGSKPRDPELIPVPVNALWTPPRGTFPLGIATPATTKVVPLPGTCRHGVLAGNGRFILFPTPSAQLLVVFDVATTGVVGFVPMPDRDSLVAGSANQLFVVSPAEGSITSYDLTTLKRERTEPLADRFGKLLALAAGHAARGPIYLLASQKNNPQLHLLNPDTLRSLDWKPDIGPFKKPNGVFTGGATADRGYLRTSANGRVLFGGVATGQQNYRVDRFELIGANPVVAPTTISQVSPAFPTADGGLTAFETNAKSTRFPMAEGNGYFEIIEKAGNKLVAMTFVGEGHVQRAEVKDVTGFTDDDGPNQDRRAFLIPSAQVLVYLRADSQSIQWRRVKVGDELKNLTQDYLVVSSTPPATATRGKTFQYDPKVLSNSGDTTFRLDVAPPGMTIQGKSIAWDVPESGSEVDVAVELVAESKLKSNVVTKQRFTVALVSASPSAAGGLFAPKIMGDNPIRSVKGAVGEPAAKFTGEPIKTANRGKPYRMKVDFRSPEDATLYILSAPAGAKWDANDFVWEVPSDAALEPVPVVIAAQTASKHQVVLGFLVEIQE